MSRVQKTISKILAGGSDASIAFDDLCFILERAGFSRRSGKGSHTKDGIDEILNLQPRGSAAKPYQVKQMRYELIIYWSKADECFVVEVTELPGCMADGVSYAEAVANAETVIQEWIDTAKSLGREIPEPCGKLVYA